MCGGESVTSLSIFFTTSLPRICGAEREDVMQEAFILLSSPRMLKARPRIP